MHFIRLAGCSVGQAATGTEVFPMLKTQNEAWMCHTYDGRPFFCDTDFGFHHWANFAELLDDTWEEHVCITGGEPLIHKDKLAQFIEEAHDRGIMVHIETSGTIDWRADLVINKLVWISVSPKQDVLPEMIDAADEIKLLVDEKFDISYIPREVLHHPLVYIQPINDELMVRKDNFERCMMILRIHPEWHLSVQTHKLLNLR